MGSSPIRVATRYASVAQLVEQGTENPRVVGSIPTGGTISADLAHLVERHLAKVEVAGSSPVIRSKTKSRPLWSAFCFMKERIRGVHPPRTLRVLRVLSRLLLCRIASPRYTRLALLATRDITSSKTVINRFVTRSPRNQSCSKIKSRPLWSAFCFGGCRGSKGSRVENSSGGRVFPAND